jgi:hypothetical protein
VSGNDASKPIINHAGVSYSEADFFLRAEGAFCSGNRAGKPAATAPGAH